jgi:hypothetical protein
MKTTDSLFTVFVSFSYLFIISTDYLYSDLLHNLFIPF